MSDARSWHYVLNGVQMGPVGEGSLRIMVREGELDPGTLVWTEGMPEWQPASVALASHAGAPVQRPSDKVVFFPVSTLKFVTMSIVTLGLYQIYWSYRNWVFLRREFGMKVIPVARAWFVVFFGYSLLKQIKVRAVEYGVPASYSPGWLFVALLALLIASRLPAPYWPITTLAFVPLLPAVDTINRLNAGRVARASMNARFTAWNIVGIVLGGLVLAMALFGTYLQVSGVSG